ncbi:tRNA (N(6)-L-threonylcarbamoyladenosine(37)-C(2))-methylthiotransferase [Candidatus Woesearchaeota archaeon]|nr:tRNA (N(6)-L-threonylcarbamoyladenosine(37)-C(2))-methylthiotransferase [Candidatus Woesearchaeota archaeon]
MRRVYIKTFGCTLNRADSEIMAGLLKASGRYEIVESRKDADLVIINSCTVKKKAETKFFRYLRKTKKPKIAAGCVVQAALDKNLFSDVSVIGTEQIEMIIKAADKTLKGEVVNFLEPKNLKKLEFPHLKKKKVIEIVPVSSGCIGSCAYCKVKYARGDLNSFPVDSIKKRVEQGLDNGAKEIWLTSQDMGCYGFDTASSLHELLNEIFTIKGDYRIRIGMGNPNHILKYLDELISVYQDKRVFKFLHIPVQAGNDRILKKMNRKYSVSEFEYLVNKLKKNISGITIATDIICGFPSETKDEFFDSVELIKKVKPDVLNISRFWPRPGTKAAKMKNQIHGNLTKKRSTFLTNVFHGISQKNNKKWLGWQGKVLIDEYGKDNTFVARNDYYKPVILKGELNLGEFVDVKIKNVTTFDLRTF